VPTLPDVSLWPDAEHALDYLRRADSIPHRVEGEATLLEFVPVEDLGSGGGRLLALVKWARPRAQFVGLDFSPAMLEALHKLFARTENGDRHPTSPSPGRLIAMCGLSFYSPFVVAD
jgi:SAM-dependent methyltransferase